MKEVRTVFAFERWGLTVLGMRSFWCEGNIFHIYIFKFIYLFIYGCVGSSFLCEGFL